MASWAVHFRIADYFINKLDIDEKYFIIGNIAPDCGMPCEDGYNPPSSVTHRTFDESKSDCDYISIFNDYLNGETDIKAISFWIGYIVHYITDRQWAIKTCIPIVEQYGPFSQNRDIAAQLKRELYNLDFTFFKFNKSHSFELFKTYNAFEEAYPDFYKNHEITMQMKNIVKFYSSNEPCEMEYIYTTPEIVENFISQTPEVILDSLKKLGLV